MDERADLPSKLSKIMRFVTWGFGALAGICFLVLPLSTLQPFYGSMAQRIDKYYSFIVFALLFASLLSYFLEKVFEQWKKAPKKRKLPKPRIQPKWLLPVQIILSVVIFVQVAAQMNLAFDLDENQRAAAAMTKSFLHEINPFRHTEVHAVSSVFSILSMKVFGPTKIAFRIPALVFSALFLVMFGFFARRFLSPLTTTLLLSHFATNQLLIWYMHSQRGYISAMFITTALFYLLYQYMTGTLVADGKRIFLIGFLFLLAIFCHPFTGIFALMVLLSFVQWMYVERKSLDKKDFTTGSYIIAYASATLPVFVAMSMAVLRTLEPIQNVHAGGFEDHLSKLSLVLPSLFRAWAFRLFVLFLAVAGLVRYFMHGFKRPSFLTLFVGNTFLFFGAVLVLLEVSHLEARWFIPFMVPFVMWVGEWITQIPKVSVQRAIYIPVFALLTLLPLSTRSGILDTIGIVYNQSYDDFLTELRSKTAPVSNNCYSFPDVNMGKWAREFYFLDAEQDPTKCENRYVVSLRITPVEQPKNSTIILDRGNDYIAFKMRN